MAFGKDDDDEKGGEGRDEDEGRKKSGRKKHGRKKHGRKLFGRK